MIDYILNVGYTFLNMIFLPLLAFLVILYFNKTTLATKKLQALSDDPKTFDTKEKELNDAEEVRKKNLFRFFGVVVIVILVLSAVSPSNTPKRTSTEVEGHHKAMVAKIKAENDEKLRQVAEKSLDSALRPNKLTDEESQKRFEELTKVKKDQE